MKFIYGCWKLYGMLCQLQSDPSGDHVVVRRSKKITPNTGGRKYMATGQLTQTCEFKNMGGLEWFNYGLVT